MIQDGACTAAILQEAQIKDNLHIEVNDPCIDRDYSYLEELKALAAARGVQELLTPIGTGYPISMKTDNEAAKLLLHNDPPVFDNFTSWTADKDNPKNAFVPYDDGKGSDKVSVNTEQKDEDIGRPLDPRPGIEPQTHPTLSENNGSPPNMKDSSEELGNGQIGALGVENDGMARNTVHEVLGSTTTTNG